MNIFCKIKYNKSRIQNEGKKTGKSNMAYDPSVVSVHFSV